MKRSFLLFILSLIAGVIYAQQLELIAPAGDFFINANYSVSWSLGEPVVGTIITDNLIVSQGYQQVIKKDVDVPEEEKNELLQLIITPNPAHNEVTLVVENLQVYQNSSLKCIVYSIIGEAIMELNLKAVSTKIDISGLTPGIYLFRIFNAKQTLQFSRTIQKN